MGWAGPSQPGWVKEEEALAQLGKRRRSTREVNSRVHE